MPSREHLLLDECRERERARSRGHHTAASSPSSLRRQDLFQKGANVCNLLRHRLQSTTAHRHNTRAPQHPSGEWGAGCVCSSSACSSPHTQRVLPPPWPHHPPMSPPLLAHAAHPVRHAVVRVEGDAGPGLLEQVVRLNTKLVPHLMGPCARAWRRRRCVCVCNCVCKCVCVCCNAKCSCWLPHQRPPPSLPRS